MPYVDRDGCSLYYEVDGEGPTVAFVGDLGYGAWQWAWQAPAVAGPFESLVADQRGAGRSDAPDGPYQLPQLAADLEAVLADHEARAVHLVGAGLGGAVALRYALTYGRARSLALIGTAAGPPHLPERPVDRLAAPRDDEAALRATLEPVLSDAFAAAQADVIDGIVAWRREGDADLDGWAAQAGALDGFDATDRLYEVTLPALVIHGTGDPVWPVAGGRALAEGLPRGRFEPIDGASHLVGVERSRTVNDLLTGFLESQAEDALDR